MPSHHQATPDEWAQQANWAADGLSASSCIVELKRRIEALEAFDHHPLVAAVRAQSKTVAHLGNRVERLEELHAAVVDLNQRFSLDPLVARIEALEAAQHLPAKPEHQDKLDRLIEQDRSDARQLTLVERVADAIEAEDGPIPAHGPAWEPEARAAIRVVAAAALQMHPDPSLTWERVALWLEQEANR